MEYYIPAGEKGKCTGCGLCAEKCPQKCIQMKRDKEGFAYPTIDMAQCVQCKICERSCQALTASDMFYPKSHDFFCAVSSDKDELLKSSSGGIFSLLAKSFIRQGDYIAGCMYDDNMTAVHVLTNDEEVLSAMRGSKYVQSNLQQLFLSINDILRKGKKVLFTGTGCQISAVRAFVGERFQENLYTVEILCHGVPSPLFFECYVRYLERKHHGRVTDIQFRNKEKDGWGSEHKTCVLLRTGDGKVKKVRPFMPAYFSSFFYGMNLRESCYACKYAQGQRTADLSIGDFWGAWKKYGRNFDEGISVAAVNSEKGKQLSQIVIDNSTHFEWLSEKEAMHGNDSFYSPVVRPKEREAFYDNVERSGYAGIWKKVYLNKTYRKKVFKSLYGALIPKKIRMIRHTIRRKLFK